MPPACAVANATIRSVQRRGFIVRGIVQGVGFRPFVYGLAQRHGARRLRAERRRRRRDRGRGRRARRSTRFARALERRGAGARPRRRASRARARAARRGGLHDRGQRARQAGSALIPADVATCDDCLRELFDPADRRYRYPFINCTQCGPRFTIVTRGPLRPAAHDDGGLPAVRRLPARVRGSGRPALPRRADRCPVCGPRALAAARRGRRRCSRSGAILAVKGLGGYHLACDAGGRGRGRAAARAQAPRGQAVRADDDRAGRARRAVGRPSARCSRSRARPIVLVRRRWDAPAAPVGRARHALARADAALHAAAPPAARATSAARS